MNHVVNNLIIANYGSSQGFDTDDGSSWYNISSNFFFMADAKKMDYGGHDNVFTDNVIYVRDGDGQNCINTNAYLPGHGLTYARNKCILPFSKTIGHTSGCQCPRTKTMPPTGASQAAGIRPGSFPQNPTTECGVTFADNEYFGIDMNLTMDCGGKAPSTPCHAMLGKLDVMYVSRVHMRCHVHHMCGSVTSSTFVDLSTMRLPCLQKQCG